MMSSSHFLGISCFWDGGVRQKYVAWVLVGCRIKFRVHHHVFSGISCFWGSKVHQKYAVWVLVRCGIKFHIQRALPIENLIKNTGRYVKNMNTKSSFFLSSSKINQYYFIILTIILLFSFGGPF